MPLITFTEEAASSWYAGIVALLEIPPPPAYPSSSFHVVSAGGGPSADSCVPPTAVMNGCPAGIIDAELGVDGATNQLQSVEPESPAAAKTDCPWIAASSSSMFSAADKSR